MYSYSVNYAEIAEWMIHGRTMTLPAELCVAFYCFELIFDGVLIYGAHKKLEISGPHVYDNQLHEFVSGEPKVDANGVYNTTTTVPTVVLY
ncbi:Superoxide dismutase copper/zinc binding protein [Operophtera brumata]|uniref:Superoxide dismutase copper/zinc binding protein n=1 Tax=Operophtera brumata TaxID=104452 RepID=A0A0L7L951_OPEBR|nr:Superoxide dismutase copper/zinc binding protein [Operophtera brumata]